MNAITDIKLTTTAAARIAQNEIAAKAIALFGAEAVKAETEIKRETNERGLVYNANVVFSVSIDLTKTDFAKRWIAANAAGVTKGLKADDVRIAGQETNQWDRDTITLARLTGADTNLRARQIWSVNVTAATLPKNVRSQPYTDKWITDTYVAGEWTRTEVPFADVIALSVARTASIDVIEAYRVEGTLNGRRYDSNSRAFKIGTFIDSAAEKADDLFQRLDQQIYRIEQFVAGYDLAAEQTLIAKREAEFAVRKARADFINAQIGQANRDSGASSCYDSRQIAEYSAEGLSAGRLDIRTSNLTVAEVDAILAILTGAGRRIAAAEATESPRA